MKWRAEQLTKEAEIMKDVPGWKVGEKLYENDRWAPQGFDLDGNPVSKIVEIIIAHIKWK